MSSDAIEAAAREAGDHPALETAARIGYAVTVLLPLLIGWITPAGRLGELGQWRTSGALASLAGNGAGRFALWVGVIGFLGLGIWQLVDAIVGPFGEDMDAWADGARRSPRPWSVSSWGGGPWFARGKQCSSRQQSVDFAASLLRARGGLMVWSSSSAWS